MTVLRTKLHGFDSFAVYSYGRYTPFAELLSFYWIDYMNESNKCVCVHTGMREHIKKEADSFLNQHTQPTYTTYTCHVVISSINYHVSSTAVHVGHVAAT